MDSRAEFEAWVETQSESMECIYELFLSEDERGNYVDGITQTAFMAFKAGQASRQTLEGEPVTAERIADTVRDYLGDIFACTRVWEAWQVGTMTQNDFTPADETELADDIATAVAEIYTHPASADVPDAEYIRVLQDACNIIQADANTEQNYRSLCRIGNVLAKLKAAPAMADKQARVPSVLYDGYAVLQEVKRAHAKSGRTDAPRLSAMVSDVLDAAAKLIKKEQDQ